MQQHGYVQISQTPSLQLSKVLAREPSIVAGQSYLCLGLLRGDAIIVVDSENDVVTLPYVREDFIQEL